MTDGSFWQRACDSPYSTVKLERSVKRGVLTIFGTTKSKPHQAFFFPTQTKKQTYQIAYYITTMMIQKTTTTLLWLSTLVLLLLFSATTLVHAEGEYCLKDDACGSFEECRLGRCRRQKVCFNDGNCGRFETCANNLCTLQLCFSGRSSVQVRGREHPVPMEHVKVGDYVRVGGAGKHEVQPRARLWALAARRPDPLSADPYHCAQRKAPRSDARASDLRVRPPEPQGLRSSRGRRTRPGGRLLGRRGRHPRRSRVRSPDCSPRRVRAVDRYRRPDRGRSPRVQLRVPRLRSK